MFDCATLVSALVKEGPRNVSFVHSQPPARRGSIGSFGSSASCRSSHWTSQQERLAEIQFAQEENEEQRDFRSSAVDLCIGLHSSGSTVCQRDSLR